MADAMYVNYVINVKNDIIVSDICHGLIWQYGCQKNRLDLRIAVRCHSITFWTFKRKFFWLIFKVQIFLPTEIEINLRSELSLIAENLDQGLT